MTSHVLAFSLFLPGHVAGDDTPSRYSNTMQHCPSCACKLVLLLDKFGEIRHTGPRSGHYASPSNRDDQPLSPGPPAYGTPLTAMSPEGCGEKPREHSPAMCGSHAYLSQLSSSGSIDPMVSVSTDVSEYTNNSVAETRRMIRGGWYCSHCGVHIKPGNDGTSSKLSKSRKSGGDDNDYDAWEAQVQDDFCAFLSAIRESFAARELQLQNIQVDLIRREKSLLNKEDLFRERMAKLGRAEDIMQQKVKRLMLYKEAMMAQIKSQVSKARAYKEKMMSKHVTLVTRWTQTDISTAWRYGMSLDEPRQREEASECDNEGCWPPQEEDLSPDRSELRGGTSPRERRGYGRLDDAPATRLPESRGPSRDDARPTYRGYVGSRIPAARPDNRRPMSLDRQSSRVGQSGIQRTRSASERDEAPGVPRANCNVIQRNHRPLRSPNATQVRFERSPQRLVEHMEEENPFACLDESDEVFVSGDAPAAAWRDQQRDVSYQARQLQTHTPRHRNSSKTTPRMAGSYHPGGAVKEQTRPAYRSMSANKSSESSRRPVSIGPYNATPKHNNITSRQVTSPDAYEFLGADSLMLSANGEQKTPDSGYLSPQESRWSPTEKERQARSLGVPRRTASSTNQRQHRSEVVSPRYAREKPSLRAPTSYMRRAADRPGRPVSAHEQSRSASRLPMATKQAEVKPRPAWSSRPRRDRVRSASEPPCERCAPGGYGGSPCGGSGGSGDVDNNDDNLRPAAVSRSFYKAANESFFEADAERYENAGRWQSPDSVRSPPSKPAHWTSSETTTQWTSSCPAPWQNADSSPGDEDGNDRNSDYISSLMQRELDRSCTPAQPKKYFDLAPTNKRWLCDYPLAESTAASPHKVQRPTKSRLPHKIATYRRMAAHNEKAAVH